MRHRGGGGPGEVIVQHASEPFVAIKSSILQGLIETGDRSLVHLFVQSIAAVSPHDGRLTAVLVGVCCWTTECLRPVGGQALGMLGMISVAERMTNNFVFQHARVPCVSQSQHPVETARCFINCLHDFSILSFIILTTQKLKKVT